MQLTTPEAKEYDPVFPAENWFFYWKTSPSLWESKLRLFNCQGPLLIPINWGFHAENPEKYDFGEYRPETNLKRLIDTCQHLGVQVALIVPTSPMPFLPNGGVPPHHAQAMSVDGQGLGMSVIDNDDRVNKIFSFFSPDLFRAYRNFLFALAQYVGQSGISCEIFGADFGYVSENQFHSYIEDYSHCFEKGFNRYVKQLQNAAPEKIDAIMSDPLKELALKREYSDSITGLYQEVVKEAFAANWVGNLSITAVGGRPRDIFDRSTDFGVDEIECFRSFMELVCSDSLPSTVLLAPKLHRGVFHQQVKDLVNEYFLVSTLGSFCFSDQLQMGLLPLIFFEIDYVDKYMFYDNKIFERYGLKKFFDHHYQWTYRFKRNAGDLESEEFDYRRVHFYFGKTLDKKFFSEILKIFLNGGKIFLDTSEMNEELSSKLNLFIMENNLKFEKVNFYTQTTKIQLGEGMLILYEGEALASQSLGKKIKFWESMIYYLKVKQLKVEADEDVFFYWSSRSSNTYELDYQEIRRVSFYNPTSYKKKAQVQSAQNFAFLKSVDSVHAQMKSTPIGVQIELMPGGSISLDFGHYE